MFVICATISYALRHGLEYHIPAHTLNDSVWEPMFTHLENPNWNPELPTIIIKEEQHNFKRIPFLEGWEAKNIIIDGYRQSIQYFEIHLPEVRRVFGFDYTVRKQDWCCTHVRHGDYLNYPDKHPIISEQYLLESISRMIREGFNKFVFFSDDIEWCKFFYAKYKTLLDGSINEYAFINSGNEKSDFQSMLMCGSYIISNSTYSLMAAILSESKDKIVISPSKENWFGPSNSHLCVDDILPDSFIQIKY